MKERIVLVSDPTGEFPSNTNVDFKVRIPDPIQLRGQGWKTALWGISVPDGGQSSKVLLDDPTNVVLTSTYIPPLQESLTKRRKPFAFILARTVCPMLAS